MSDDQHEPDEQALTDAARRQAEEDNREAPDDRPMGPIGNTPSRAESVERAGEAGLTEASMPGQGPTADEATPETLNPDDGSRSAEEAGTAATPADTELTDVGKAGAGGRYGLDEAELGRAKPLDGKPWDGDPNEPLEPETATDRNLTADPNSEPDRT
ncbi:MULTISPECIES: hypothetical protein [Halopseudomonas]|uniref:Phosphotransferase system, HPr-related protein n=1 Tax=Halopseudomonas bauzanensis TaxID=653930 RepID=A0A1I4MBE2_9GAMM|nr:MULTISPECIES: hypothetical protein [Halopseudomonas]WGK62073.1 hypothetical protein QAO71_02180 [Halopseudomonas sp. SMJS2]SER98537.1 hypothetical protein SAMN05216589_1894 [Halopseudomonas bauzanensis]SFM00672.1 hypothetical protein SAMN04487855_1892 [Halopseudomonas bauzanensis]